MPAQRVTLSSIFFGVWASRASFGDRASWWSQAVPQVAGVHEEAGGLRFCCCWVSGPLSRGGFDTPGLGQAALWAREQGAHFARGTGLGGLRARASVGGQGWRTGRHLQAPGPLGCRHSVRPEHWSCLWTRHGGAFWTACSGCSLPELSGCTLGTIYSPEVLGTSGGVTSVTLKSPWGLPVLENIFSWWLGLDVQRKRLFYCCNIV